MAMGNKCPNCKEQTYHENGSYYECSECNYIGWPGTMPVSDVGAGPGKTCPNCDKLTLHDIYRYEDETIVRRCATCNHTGIQLAAH